MHPQALGLLQLLMTRLVDDNLCSNEANALQLSGRNPAFTPEMITMYNTWLMQSNVRDDQLAGSEASADLSARAPSHSPFTTELVRRCHVRMDSLDDS